MLVLAACSSEAADQTVEAPTTKPEPTTTTTAIEAVGYPAIDDIDPHTHGYFIALEDGRDDLFPGNDDEFIWNLGVTICENLDEAGDIGAEVDRLATQQGYDDAAGGIIAAAVGFICEHHEDAARDWVNANT